jgi:hypothetical protein
VPFPSKEHQFKGGERRGLPKPAIAARKAKKLRRQAAVFAAAFGEPEPVRSNAEWLKAVRDGKVVPTGEQLMAAIALQRHGIDHDDAEALAEKAIINLDGLDEEERVILAKLLLKAMPKPGAPQIEHAPSPASVVVEAAPVPDASQQLRDEVDRQTRAMLRRLRNEWPK